MVNPDVDSYKTRNKRKTVLRKTQKTTTYRKLKEYQTPKYKLSGGPVFTLSLPRERFAPLIPVSYVGVPGSYMHM